LGGFCLLMLVANTILFLGRFTPGVKEKSPPQGWWIGFVFSLLGIWLSMSLLVIVLSQVFLAGIGILIFGRVGKKRADTWVGPYGLLLIIPLIILLSGVCYLRPEADQPLAGVIGNSDSVSRRIVLLQYSWEMFRSSPVFGVGLGNFIPTMPERPIGQTYFWQPVHNIPVLLLTELGLAGMAIIGLLIWKGIRKLNIKYKILKIHIKNLKISKNLPITHYPLFIIISWWLIIFITGFFDHYWLTLQQGRLMLVMVIGLTFTGASKSEKAKR